MILEYRILEELLAFLQTTDPHKGLVTLASNSSEAQGIL